jgi:hypothetical protein
MTVILHEAQIDLYNFYWKRLIVQEFGKRYKYCHVVWVTINGGWIGKWNYWHDSELQAITALLLIYTLYKLLQHTPSLSFIIFTIRCLVTALNIGDSSASVFTLLPAGEYYSQLDRTENIPFLTVTIAPCSFVSAGSCLRSRCPEGVAVHRVTVHQRVYTPQHDCDVLSVCEIFFVIA